MPRRRIAALLPLALAAACASGGTAAPDPSAPAPGSSDGGPVTVTRPVFVPPRMTRPDPDDMDLGGASRYRALTRDDFQASAPQAQLAVHAENVGADACVVLPGGIERGVQVRRDPGSGQYVARAVNVDKYALIVPACSWWGVEPGGLPPGYVLEHEQIHFALSEIEARRAIQETLALEVRADTRTDAALELQSRIDAIARGVRGRLLEVNARFDLETSGHYAPDAQAAWRARVEAELARLPPGPGRPVEAPPRSAPPPRRDPSPAPL